MKSLDDGPGNATDEKRAIQNVPPFDLDARDRDTVPCNDGGRAHLPINYDTQIEHMPAPTTRIQNQIPFFKKVSKLFFTIFLTSSSGSCTVRNGITLNRGGSFRGDNSETNFEQKFTRTW